MATIDDDIDALYRLPLGEFTAARNALAKKTGGEEGARIRKLEKASTPAWGVNQLYWNDRPLYDQLIKAADELRKTHRALLAGKSVDLQKAEAAHRERARAGAARIRELLGAAGEAVTDATMNAVSETLDALPAADETPGRLIKPLKRMGFEALAGVTPAPPGARKLALVDKGKSKALPPPPKPSAAKQREIEAAEIRIRTAEAEERQAEKELEQARRAVQRAEQALELGVARRKKLEQELAKLKEA